MKTTHGKRARERAKQDKQREKAARRVQRKEEQAAHPRPKNGEDPDLAGMKPGPQAPLFR